MNQRHRLLSSLLVVLVLTCAAPARAATEYPDPYGCTTVKGRCNKSNDARYPIQFKSHHDGVKDHYFVRFPDKYDKHKAYPLLIHFHAWCAGNSAIADPRMLRQVSNDNQVIFIGHRQRGTATATAACGASFLGDGKKEAASAAVAAQKDIGELLNELAARFNINYVIAAGSSMGGYVALRMPTLFPDKVHVSFATAPALKKNHSLFPEPTHVLNAAATGLYSKRYVYSIIGTKDTDFISVNRDLNKVMKGKPHWTYLEVAGEGHVNFFADDWNLKKGYCKDPNLATSHCWYVSTKTTPKLWEGVKTWEKANPLVAKNLLEPDCNWKAPAKMADWYLTKDLYDRGGRTWPRPLPPCNKSDAGPADGPKPSSDGPKPKSDGPKPGSDGPQSQKDGSRPTADGGTEGKVDRGDACSCNVHNPRAGVWPLLALTLGLVLRRRV